MKMPANPVDCHVGSRVRMRRMLAGISQERLGKGLGITFQQVQKYEKGANRISASRLQQIASMLDVPVAYFFDGAPIGDMPQTGLSYSEPSADLVEFLKSSGGLQLAKAFSRIASAKVRRRIVNLAETLAEETDNALEG